jgi:hypothetical protein
MERYGNDIVPKKRRRSEDVDRVHDPCTRDDCIASHRTTLTPSAEGLHVRLERTVKEKFTYPPGIGSGGLFNTEDNEEVWYDDSEYIRSPACPERRAETAWNTSLENGD